MALATSAFACHEGVMLELPTYLEPKCQTMLENIQRADSMTNALLAERMAELDG